MRHLDDAAYLCGAVLIVVGVGLFSVPAGLIVAGLVLVALARVMGA